jgi:hypothetical protein
MWSNTFGTFGTFGTRTSVTQTQNWTPKNLAKSLAKKSWKKFCLQFTFELLYRRFLHFDLKKSTWVGHLEYSTVDPCETVVIT